MIFHITDRKHINGEVCLCNYTSVADQTSVLRCFKQLRIIDTWDTWEASLPLAAKEIVICIVNPIPGYVNLMIVDLKKENITFSVFSFRNPPPRTYPQKISHNKSSQIIIPEKEQRPHLYQTIYP